MRALSIGSRDHTKQKFTQSWLSSPGAILPPPCASEVPRGTTELEQNDRRPIQPLLDSDSSASSTTFVAHPAYSNSLMPCFTNSDLSIITKIITKI